MKSALSMHGAATLLVATSLGLSAGSADVQKAGSRQTREFVQASVSSDQFEILAAETALTQSASPEIKAFAEHMRSDHQQLAKAMMAAVTRSGLKPPDMAMSADQAQLLGALQGVGTKEFDALYLKQQLLAHRSALVVEEMYSKSGGDLNVRQSASAAVPVVRSHIEMAIRAAAQLGSQ